jgi:hypothetical protein
MPDKDADKQNRETERSEHEEKSREQSPEEDREKKKLPEPPGNLRRRAEWFKKRH